MLKIFVSVVLLGLMSACSTVPATDGSSYRDREAATGSNIPRKGSATTVSSDSVDDLRNRTSGINLRSGS